jgi:hypothetical protein
MEKRKLLTIAATFALVLTTGGVLLLGLLPETAKDASRIIEARPISAHDPRLAVHEGREMPSPTEIAKWKADRKERRLDREAWYESLHWAAPGTDWRAIEAANRRALSLERFANIERGERTDQWDELGSVNLAGRTHAAHPSGDGQSLYIGSNLGGVWHGTIDGENWTAIGDGLGTGSNQLLVVPAGGGPGEPEVVISLTSGGPGAGGSVTMVATTDNGATWFVPEGLPQTVWGYIRVVRDAADPRTVLLLTRGRYETGDSRDYTGYLISRSTDGGITFEFRSVQPTSAPTDMWIDRVSGGPLYVMSGNTMRVSYDQGLTFTDVGTAAANPSGVILVGSEAGAPTFYAALSDGGWKLYRSTDGGANWEYRYAINDFWNTVAASITDPDLVFFAGVECYRSTNGGASFSKINNWYDYYGNPEFRLHADLPGMDVHWVNGQEAIYFNTDGGTFVSYDGGATVQNISLWGLAVSQYYGIFTSQTDPYLIAAGSQDQGFQVATLDARNGYLPFEQTISGDYGHLTSTVRDHNALYSVYPGFVLVQVLEDNPSFLLQLDFPAGSSHSWMPFILADPLDADIFYLCADHLWRYERISGSYFEMTELPQDFAPTGGYLTGLAISPVDYNYWYAVNSSGLLWYSRDAGATWTQSGEGPAAHYFYGTAIVASPNDRNLAFVGGSGYSDPPVWRTTDGGILWEPMSDGLPGTLVLGLTLGGTTGDDLYAACETGPYGYNAWLGEWESISGTEAPLTTYWCIEWVPEIGVVRYGTYGRGIWDYTPRDPADVVAEDNRPATRLSLAVAPNPAREQVTLRFRQQTAGHVNVALFDVTGRQVAVVANRAFSAGDHAVRADLGAARITPGIYLARLSGPDGVVVRKLQVQ